MKELFAREATNPILTPADFPAVINAAFNPGVAVVDGETVLLVRVEDRTGISRFAVARSADGVGDWTIDPACGMRAETARFEEHWGIEDPRITTVGDVHYVVYTGYSRAGPLVLLAETRDFDRFERRGILVSPEDKDAALFPATFDGRWALVHRPAPATMSLGAHIWLSFSPDLRHWGESSVIVPARRGAWWDADKVGLGPPPLLTEQGWLLCYHGVRTTAAGSIYRLGLALLDRHDPSVLLARGSEWVFGPSAPYERAGDVPDVVFPCGWVLEPDGDTIRMYYGASDTVVCLARASLAALLDHLERHPSEHIDDPDRSWR